MNALLNIPAHKNCKNCGDCCSLIPSNNAEIQEIRNYLDKHPNVRALAIKQSGQALHCPFRNNKNRRCAIYSVRPMICRLMGVSIRMECKHGNSARINGCLFLEEHSLNEVVLLNFEDWRA